MLIQNISAFNITLFVSTFTRKEMCKFSYYLTRLMVVDVLTKGIVKPQFEMCKEELGLTLI
jgi:hypothetical protein